MYFWSPLENGEVSNNPILNFRKFGIEEIYFHFSLNFFSYVNPRHQIQFNNQPRQLCYLLDVLNQLMLKTDHWFINAWNFFENFLMVFQSRFQIKKNTQKNQTLLFFNLEIFLYLSPISYQIFPYPLPLILQDSNNNSYKMRNFHKSLPNKERQRIK